MTVLRTVRATEPTAVFSPQRKYKTVGSKIGIGILTLGFLLFTGCLVHALI